MRRAWVLLAALLAFPLSGLAQSEAQRVAVAEHDRSLQACISGWGYCDHSVLTSAEAQRVAAIEHNRNLKACMSGWGYCDHSLLTAPNQNSVTTPSEANSTVPPSIPDSTKQSAPTSVATECAENGSCYGDPNANGVRKTVHVNGYYRKDGTYVRGHYRSAPGT